MMPNQNAALADEGPGSPARAARRASPLTPNDLERPRRDEWMVDVIDVLVAAALFSLVLGFIILH
jgi:hypothetical protein